MSNDINILKDYIPEASSEQKEAFVQYFEILSHFNQRINLISPSTLKSAGRLHFADSYMGIKLFEKELPSDKLVYDFGSGNGFPGIISAIMIPETQFMLVERDKRKGEFLKHLAHELGLKNVKVHTGNAAQINDGKVGFAMSRAMAPMPKILLELRSCFASGGELFLFKGDHWTTEFGNCPAQVFDYWEINLKGTYAVPGSDIERFIVQCSRI